MNKVLSGLLTTLLLTTGLLTATSTESQAACGGYPGPCIKTAANLRGYGQIPNTKPIKYTAIVRSRGSNAVPRGTFVFTMTGPNGYSITRSKKVDNDGRVPFVTRNLKNGTYYATVRYIKKPGSRFKNSTSVTRKLFVHDKR